MSLAAVRRERNRTPGWSPSAEYSCGFFKASLDDQFHETHPIGCHHSSLVNLACRSYILVIRSWSAYDSNHGSARLVAGITHSAQSGCG